jgi:hypothetical protein
VSCNWGIPALAWPSKARPEVLAFVYVSKYLIIVRRVTCATHLIIALANHRILKTGVVLAVDTSIFEFSWGKNLKFDTKCSILSTFLHTYFFIYHRRCQSIGCQFRNQPQNFSDYETACSPLLKRVTDEILSHSDRETSRTAQHRLLGR